MQHFQPFLAVQHTCPCAHHFEIVEYVSFNADKPRPRRLVVVCFHGKGQILGLDIAIVAPFKLPFQNPRIFHTDRIQIVTARRDLKAPCNLFLVGLSVDKVKLHMDGSVEIVIQVAQIFKDCRLRIGLGKLVVHIVKLNAFGIALAAQIADAVLVHGVIGYAVLRRMGLAVALVLADYFVNLLFFCAGQLYFFRCGLYCLGQSPLPPFPFDAAAQGRRMRCWSDRVAPLGVKNSFQ